MSGRRFFGEPIAVGAITGWILCVLVFEGTRRYGAVAPALLALVIVAAWLLHRSFTVHRVRRERNRRALDATEAGLDHYARSLPINKGARDGQRI